MENGGGGGGGGGGRQPKCHVVSNILQIKHSEPLYV